MPSDALLKMAREIDEFVKQHPPNWHHRCDAEPHTEYAAWSECEFRRLLTSFAEKIVRQCEEIAGEYAGGSAVKRAIRRKFGPAEGKEKRDANDRR